MEQQNRADAVVVVEPYGVEPEPPKVPENMQEALREITKEKGVTFNEDGSVTPIGQQQPQVADGNEGKEQVESQTSEQPEGSKPESTGQPPAQKADEKPVEVPKKFQNPDGSTNEQRVQKSLMNAEEALRKYETLEKELARKKAEVSKARMGLPADQVQANPQAQTFEKQLEADVQKYGLGAVMARLFDAAQQSAVEQAKVQIEEIKTENQRNRMRSELESIAKHDPSILTEDGIAELQKVRELYPEVNYAENPWTAAYRVHLAQKVMQERASAQVQNPTPKAPTAPTVPAGAVQRPVVAKTPKSFASKEELNSFVNSLPPEKQEAFWKEQFRGLGYK